MSIQNQGVCAKAYVEGSSVVIPCSGVVQAAAIRDIVISAPLLYVALEAMRNSIVLTGEVDDELLQRTFLVLRTARGES